MRKILSASPLAVCTLGALALFGCSSGLVQSGIQSPAPTQPQNGIVQDWSTQHTLYPSVGLTSSMVTQQNDPREMLAWANAQRQNALAARNPVRFPNVVQRDVHTDWSISLGGGGVAVSMYPAKFNFDVTAPDSCANDFVVFPVNVAGGVAQPNIVAFNNLYSGTTPTNGICNRTASGSDTGVAGTTMWSYNVTAGTGLVPTSPSLSLDGTKVVFVESGTPAHFHVLAWKSGDGVNAGNLQDVTAPKQLTSSFSATQPAAGSGTATDLSFGAANDTLSSPFVDYGQDQAYVGNDAGLLFRINNVFCTSPGCTSNGSPAPSLDATWGATGKSVCSGHLTGAVVDSATGNIFVGCADGKLYGFTHAGVALTNSPVTVGSGSGTTGGGIVDPPLVDDVNGVVYAVAGASGVGGPEVVVQAKIADLSGAVTATLGSGGHFNMHDPAFNNAYFNGGGTAFLYAWGLNAGDTQIELWGITFGGGMAMTSGTPVNGLAVAGSSAVELSPVTEFFNGGTSVDATFVGGLLNNPVNFIENNVSGGFPGGSSATAGEGSGTSGIIVDNQSTDAQASSIYFGVLSPGTNANSAVKLTQAALQ